MNRGPLAFLDEVAFREPSRVVLGLVHGVEGVLRRPELRRDEQPRSPKRTETEPGGTVGGGGGVRNNLRK